METTEQTINFVIDKLKQELGPLGQKVWDTLILQAKIERIDDIVVWISTICVVAFTFMYYKKTQSKYEKDCYDDVEWITDIRIALTVVSCILVAFSLTCISLFITKTYNPSYWALQKLLQK